MSTLIFTPGPLHAQPAAGEHNWLVYSERDGHTIATVHDVYGGKPEMRGNAELYAKAPQMLRFVEALADGPLSADDEMHLRYEARALLSDLRAAAEETR